ncbi:MAG: hypothetical protein ACK421_01785 [Pseudanabaenaceae cyanobacterium]
MFVDPITLSPFHIKTMATCLRLQGECLQQFPYYCLGISFGVSLSLGLDLLAA